MTAVRRAFLPKALAALALAGGCARVPPPELRVGPAELLAGVRAAQERIRGVRGTARVGVRSPAQSGSLDAFLAAEKPDRVRIEALDFFGNVAAALASDGRRFGYFDAATGVFYRGDATPENVSRLLPVVIPAEELAVILCGSAPILEGRPLEAQPDGDRMLLVVGAGAWGQRLTVGAELAVEESRVRRLSAAAGGGVVQDAPAYDLEFGLFRHRAGGRFPTEASLDAPSAGVRLSLSWKRDLEVNPPPEPSLFSLEPPRGARLVELGPGQPVPGSGLPLGPVRE